MRLFIAIPFAEETKEQLLSIQARLRQAARGGFFTRPEHLHLTLVFLGEAPEERVPAITAAMDGVPVQPLTLQFEGVGQFGDTWWVGIRANPALVDLQGGLAQALRAKGFPIESRPYKPHLTLGRKVTLPPGLQPAELGAFEPFEAAVPVIQLMLSERLQGRLTYTALYEKQL